MFDVRTRVAGRGSALRPGGEGVSAVTWGPGAAGVDLASVRARLGSVVDAVFAVSLLVLMVISAVVVSTVVVGVMAGYIS